MLMFKGASSDQIITSIVAAQAFAKALSPEREIKKSVMEVTSEDLDKIRYAANAASLADAMEKPHGVFLFLSEFFFRHGELNTKGVGAQIARLGCF